MAAVHCKFDSSTLRPNGRTLPRILIFALSGLMACSRVLRNAILYAESKLLSVMLTSSKAARRSAGWDCLLYGWGVGSTTTGVGRELCSRVGGNVDESEERGELLGEVDGNVCSEDDSVTGDILLPATAGFVVVVGFGDDCELEGPFESD